MKRDKTCLGRGKSHKAWRGRLFWKMHWTHLHFYLQADSAVPVIQIMSQQQRNCCEKQIIKPTGAENMLMLLLCLKKKNKKLQVSHLMSTTKSWGGRKCCKNKSNRTSTYPYSGLLVVFFFSAHFPCRISVSVCVCLHVCVHLPFGFF